MKCDFLPVPRRLFPIRIAQASLAHAATTTGLGDLVGQPVLMAAQLAGPSSARKGQMLMMACESPESAESQAHGRDARRITEYGDLVKY